MVGIEEIADVFSIDPALSVCVGVPGAAETDGATAHGGAEARHGDAATAAETHAAHAGHAVRLPATGTGILHGIIHVLH